MISGCVERYDGDDTRCREAARKRFQETALPVVLLATTKSGGVGLNIVEANHVLFVDRWFNPVVQQQAEDRTYRIG